MRAIRLFRKRSIGLVLYLGLLLLISCVSTDTGRIPYPPLPADTRPVSLPTDAEITLKDPPGFQAPLEGPLQVTVRDAILLTLENNRSLVVERLNPAIRQTFEEQQRAVFDPLAGAGVSVQRTDTQRQARTGSGTESYTSDVYAGDISLSQFFPSGTTLDLSATHRSTDSSLYENLFSNSRLGIDFTQSLLRGFGSEVNLARLRQAKLDTDISQYELRGFSETLVARVESAYWDYALAQRQIEIVEESLKLSQQQLSDTEEMIKVGRLAEAELAAVQAEVASQEQALINARSGMETSRIELLRLLNPPGKDLWDRPLSLLHAPTLPDIQMDAVKSHVEVALRMRPEINQAKLGIRQDEIEIVRTKNGLLPKMDLFITLGKTGYSDSFGGSISEIASSSSYDALGGINFEYPIFNRDARAEHRRALLSREQAERALKNLTQLVELDVRSAYIEVNRSKEQISASSATRTFQEETLRIETEKFRVGRSTNFLVAQAQRDLLVSRLAEVQALANYLKALVNFYRLEGSLLERRGIAAPGFEPIPLTAQGLY